MNIYRNNCGGCGECCCPRICYVPCPVNPTTPAVRPYASFLVTGTAAATGTTLTFTPQINRGGALITGAATNILTLAAGHIYQVDYMLNGTTAAAGTAQITPLINGAAATYAQAVQATQAAPNNRFTLSGAFLIDAATAPATFALRYDGTSAGTFAGTVIVREIDATTASTAAAY